MICRLCNSDFNPVHFNQKLCSKKCKLLAARMVKSSYKKSDKGAASEARWRNSPNKKKTDLKYRKSGKGRRSATRRTARLVRTDKYVLFRKRLGQTAPYRKLRKQLLDKFRQCVSCESTDDLTIDHIIPMRMGGPHSIENLQVLCRSCNAKKGTIERRLYAVS